MGNPFAHPFYREKTSLLVRVEAAKGGSVLPISKTLPAPSLFLPNSPKMDSVDTETTTPSCSGTPFSVIPPFPLPDTLALLCIFSILPNSISVLILLLYFLLGYSKFVESTISLFFNHRLYALHNQDNGDLSSSYEYSKYRRRIIHLLIWSAIDLLIVGAMTVLNASLLDYANLLAKALVASNLASTKSRYLQDAVLSSLIFLAVAEAITYLIRNANLISFQFGISLTAFSDLTDSSLRYPMNPLKVLLYKLGSSNFPGTVFGIEHLVEILYTLLSVSAIRQNFTPFLRLSLPFNTIPQLLDSSNPESVPSRLHREEKSSDRSDRPSGYQSNSTSSQGIKIFKIRNDISKSPLPPKQINESNSSSGIFSPTSRDEKHDTPNSQTTICESEIDESTPASFPVDHQILNMNDISSPSLVVAQNFENYCRVALFPSFMNPMNLSQFQKMKLNPYVERKLKDFGNRTQQPIWAFLNAARTMFNRQDLYSGDYYQHDALVTTGTNKYARSFIDTVQCFVYYIGETDIAFLLQNIYFTELIIKVNGIIWEQLSFVHQYQYQRELIIVSGLSPLSQYDFEFISLTDDAKQELLASATVSTIHKDRILTESKPSSAIVTLQQSIVTTQNACRSEKAKLKKLRTEWRKKASAIKSEIETLNNRPNTSDEGRSYKRVESLRQAVVNCDSMISELSTELNNLYTREAEIEEQYLDEKRSYELALREFNKFENKNKEITGVEQRRVSSLNTDMSQLIQKNDKLTKKKDRIKCDINTSISDIEKMKESEIKARHDARQQRDEQRAGKLNLLKADSHRLERQLNNELQRSFT